MQTWARTSMLTIRKKSYRWLVVTIQEKLLKGYSRTSHCLSTQDTQPITKQNCSEASTQQGKEVWEVDGLVLKNQMFPRMPLPERGIQEDGRHQQQANTRFQTHSGRIERWSLNYNSVKKRKFPCHHCSEMLYFFLSGIWCRYVSIEYNGKQYMSCH